MKNNSNCIKRRNTQIPNQSHDHLLHTNQNHKSLWQISQQNHMLKLLVEQYISRQLNVRINWEAKIIFSGILEDATFKIPFVSHKINIPWQHDTVYKFDNAYVHEFPDRSLLLVITEFTDWQLKVVDGYLEYQQYVWKPKIENIKRPVQNISLVGTITTVHNNSGLVKRCNNYKSLLYDDSCSNNCNSGWGWDLRVSSRLYDGSGSIKMVLTKDVASRILQRNLSELILKHQS